LNVAEDANKVALSIGVSHAQSPRENVRKLVAYFRGFTDSDAPRPASADRSIYLDLALSKKGVCRHRAYAFLVTALAIGLPTRMVMNEAHAWVEVNDGSLWRRIDLGGAGRTLNEGAATDVPYVPPPDPFAWPAGAAPGDELTSGRPGAGSTPGGASRSDTSGAEVPGRRSNPSYVKDDRLTPQLTVKVVDPDARRGAPVHVTGEVRADGPCENVEVDVLLRDVKNHAKERLLGTLATDAEGAFSGALVIPEGVALGDYDVVVRTAGDARCGQGSSP
jgi:transglutaminase-like putative cysteine protease